MNSSGRESTDDILADVLVEFDEALAAGASKAPGSSSVELNADEAARLEREKACVRFLRELWPTRVTQAASENAKPAPRIGRFELRRELGHGGFGTVFLAFDPLLRREVALKVPRPGSLASVELRRRFLREAQAAAGLNHANIVTVFEAGECGAIGHLVAAYIAGPTLAQWMREQEKPVPVRLAARTVLDLADAVEHAHRRGILHRDIKPSNVLLAPAAAAQKDRPVERSLADFVPKLTDFGLARWVENGGDETRTGAMLGTPRYMAPEQAEGRHDRVGPATDVHALGVILYELLAGRPPHVGESDLETMFAVAHDEPAPVRRWRAGVPRDLETICQHCLEKSPGERYPSAAELADDLRRFLAGKPICARPLGPIERSAKWARRQPALAALVAFGLLSLCGFLAGGLTYTVTLRRARDVAEERRIEALDRERTIRHHVYTAEMQLAYQAYRNADHSQFREILKRHRPATNEEDIRGFEWHYLWRLCHRERMTLRGHQGDVYCATFSPDGRSLVTAGKDRIVRIWNVQSGSLERELRGHEDEVGSASFASDGSRFVTTSSDRTIRTWDYLTGQQLASWSPLGGLIGCALFSRDGKTLATSDRDGHVRLLDPATGHAVAVLPGFVDLTGWLHDQKPQQVKVISKAARILALAVSPDGKSLVAFREDGAGQMWDLARRTLRFELPPRNDSINGAAFSPSGESFATAGADGAVELWDAATGRQTARLTGHRDQVESVAFSPDGELLASAARDTTVRLWALPGGSPQGELRGHTSVVWSVAFSPDGRTLATASRDGAAKLWNVDAGLERQPLEMPNSAPVLAMAAAPDSKTVVVARRSGLLEWLRMNGDLSTRARAVISGGHANDVALSPDGSLLAAACEDGAIRLYDVVGAQPRGLLRGHAAPALCVSFSPDGKTLASGADDCKCVLWDPRTRQSLQSFSGHTSGVTAVAFLPDGKLLASASRDKTVRFWDRATGGKRAVLQCGGPVQSIAFSADGRFLAAAEGQYFSLWQATEKGGWTGPFMHAQTARRVSLSAMTGKPLLAVAGTDHLLRAFSVDSPSNITEIGVNARSRMTSCATFSKDGKTLVTGDLNGSIVAWDTATLRPQKSRLTTRIGGGPVRFSADGKLLAIGGLAGFVHLYRRSVDGKTMAIGPFPDAPFSNIALSPNGQTLIVTIDGFTRFWSQAAGHSVAPPWGDRNDVGAIEFSPDGTFVVVASGCGGPNTRIAFWSLETGRELGRIPDQPTCDRPRFAISPTGTLLAAGIGNVATIWDIATHECCASLPAHNGRIARVAFAPNGRIVATAGESDRTVRLFGLQGSENQPMAFANSANVTALAFASDGRTLVVGGSDGKLRFSNARTGHEIMTLDAHQGGVEDLAFAPDDTVMATSGKSKEGAGELFLWHGRPTIGCREPSE